MADIPPVSDPQIAALIEQNKTRRTRAILIFVVVGLVLAVGLGGSAVYASAQAKKKRNVAYSRVVKCLFGKPLDAGEAPMTRIRSAWRARILAQTSKPEHEGDLDTQEAKDASEWPNRCVATMMTFTDTLKDIGEMKEGDKDLGYYSRELSKQTAGSTWKNVDTYQAAVESFVTEAQKGNFEFVDVPDVTAPELADALSIDAAFPKATALEDLRLDPHGRVMVVPLAVRFYAPAAKGKPARLCESSDGKVLACKAITWLPPEASGVPWLISSDDGAAPLMAFGRNGGVADGSSTSTGVLRSNDGSALIPPDAFFVVGGYGRIDGSATLLLKDVREPQGDHFKIAHVTRDSSKLQLDAATLTGWNEEPTSIAMVGPYVMWVNLQNQLMGRPADAKDADAKVVATLPGPLAARRAAFTACHAKNAMYVGVRTQADGIARMVVIRTTEPQGTEAGFGKPEVVNDGDLSCGEDAAIVLTREEMSTCTTSGCTTVKVTPEVSRDELTVAIGNVIVRATKPSGLLRIEWQKDGKSIATKVYDAQMKGTVLLGEAKLGRLDLVGRRDYGLVFLDIGGTQHVARIDATGTIEPVTVNL